MITTINGCGAMIWGAEEVNRDMLHPFIHFLLALPAKVEL